MVAGCVLSNLRTSFTPMSPYMLEGRCLSLLGWDRFSANLLNKQEAKGGGRLEMDATRVTDAFQVGAQRLAYPAISPSTSLANT